MRAVLYSLVLVSYAALSGCGPGSSGPSTGVYSDTSSNGDDSSGGYDM